MIEVKISRSALERDYRELRVEEVCKKYDITLDRLYKILASEGITKKTPPRKETKKILLED